MVEIRVKKLNSFLEKARGLMFLNSIKPIYFKTRWGIHTLFLKNKIDVLILDNENKVYKLKVALKPWRIFIWNPKFYKVLELPTGYIVHKNIRPRDSVSVKY
jgi:Uncharacterized conserved protein